MDIIHAFILGWLTILTAVVAIHLSIAAKNKEIVDEAFSGIAKQINKQHKD